MFNETESYMLLASVNFALFLLVSEIIVSNFTKEKQS